MKKSDKKHNITKVNLLVEKRYLESKGLISESFEISENEKLKADDKIMWIGDDKTFPYGEPTKKGDIGRYLGQDGNGHAVSFSKVFYAGESDFKKV
jgi:hypothetical protein